MPFTDWFHRHYDRITAAAKPAPKSITFVPSLTDSAEASYRNQLEQLRNGQPLDQLVGTDRKWTMGISLVREDITMIGFQNDSKSSKQRVLQLDVSMYTQHRGEEVDLEEFIQQIIPVGVENFVRHIREHFNLKKGA